MNLPFDSHNRLFELARSGKRLPHLLVAILLSVMFVLVAGIVGGIAALTIILFLSIMNGQITPAELSQPGNQATLTHMLMPDTAVEQVILLVLSFAPIFLLLWAWLTLVEKRPLWTLGLERRGLGQKYLRGLVVGLLMFAASVGLPAALGYMVVENDTLQPQGLAALGGVLLVFLGWAVQGPAEEALTRGWLLPVIGARYKPWLGVVISSLVFAVFHSLNPHLSPIAVFNLFLFGVFTCLYALYEGGLWGVFGIHAVWNWAEGNVFGLAVSGGGAPGGTLFNLMEVGPDTITGGSFGPEGGLAVTVVLLIGCVIVWNLSQRRPAESP